LIAAESDEAIEVDRHVAHYTGKLHALADAVRERIERAVTGDRLPLLVEYLACEIGFHGNHEDYYDRRNSYLNDVLDRRVGIPITLAIVYITVGRQVGIDIHGVGFPGHFLAVAPGPPRTIIDPFQGIALDEASCAERLRAVAGPSAALSEDVLAPAAPRQIVARVLGNLKLIHFRAQEFEQALSCSERILLAQPDHPSELRDRAVLYLQLECFDAARSDLERFLALAPDDASAGIVRRQLAELRASGPQLH
jgi:regulator of sirC expression with transglutaminase-like and TPR domain